MWSYLSFSLLFPLHLNDLHRCCSTYIQFCLHLYVVQHSLLYLESLLGDAECLQCCQIEAQSLFRFLLHRLMKRVHEQWYLWYIDSVVILRNELKQFLIWTSHFDLIWGSSRRLLQPYFICLGLFMLAHSLSLISAVIMRWSEPTERNELWASQFLAQCLN